MTKRFAKLFGLFFLGLTLILGAYLASTAKAEGRADNPITICHRTHSATNPYVQITVDTDSTKFEGHEGHDEGPVPDPATAENFAAVKANGGWWGDIIPPTSDDGTIQVTPLNWDEAGQSVYSNGCNPVPPSGPTEVTTEAPAFTDPTCDQRKVTLTLPQTEGVTYSVEGTVAQGEKVVVTATADEGFVLAEGSQTKWVHRYGDAPTGCGSNHHHGGPPPKPNPKPQPNPKTTPKLAFTGVDATIPSIAMGIFALLGGAAFWLRRKLAAVR